MLNEEAVGERILKLVAMGERVDEVLFLVMIVELGDTTLVAGAESALLSSEGAFVMDCTC